MKNRRILSIIITVLIMLCCAYMSGGRNVLADPSAPPGSDAATGESDIQESDIQESDTQESDIQESDMQEADMQQNSMQEPRYLIAVNRLQNCVTVYKYSDEEKKNPIMSMACSTVADDRMPTGRYEIIDNSPWAALGDGTYSPWNTRTNGNFALVGAPYSDTDHGKLITELYNNLGNAAQDAGYVRLNDKDAKWIYDNCKEKTEILVYDDSSQAGPLGKPETIVIPPEHEYKNWDPTDETEGNPWKSSKGKIKGIRNWEIPVGGYVDLMAGVTAEDANGNDVTDEIVVLGEYDSSQEGIYIITYCIEDEFGAVTSEDITVIVGEESVFDDEMESDGNGELITDVKEESMEEEKDMGKKKEIVVAIILLASILTGAFLMWAKNRS